MRINRNRSSLSWMNLAIIVGGLLMAVLWIIYTTVHGPTSFDREGSILGRSTLFWGSMLGGPPNLLIAMGLILHYPVLAKGASILARMGYILTLLGLTIPALIDLITTGLGPPLLMPLTGLGLVLTAVGNRKDTPLGNRARFTLLVMGIVLLASFASALLVGQHVSDRFGGYRIFGFAAYFLIGLGWMVFGASLSVKAK